MEDYSAEVRIAVVSVGVPVGAAQMNLDIAAEAFAVDEDFRAQEVGTGAAVPVARMRDLDRRAGSGGAQQRVEFRGAFQLYCEGEQAMRRLIAIGLGTMAVYATLAARARR